MLMNCAYLWYGTLYTFSVLLLNIPLQASHMEIFNVHKENVLFALLRLLLMKATFSEQKESKEEEKELPKENELPEENEKIDSSDEEVEEDKEKEQEQDEIAGGGSKDEEKTGDDPKAEPEKEGEEEAAKPSEDRPADVPAEAAAEMDWVCGSKDQVSKVSCTAQ